MPYISLFLEFCMAAVNQYIKDRPYGAGPPLLRSSGPLCWRYRSL